MEANMAYVARPSDFHAAAPYGPATQIIVVPAEKPLPAPRRRFWLRMLDRLIDARQADAEQEVTQYLARRGKLTDSMEREIADRFTSGNWGPRYY
jgi:hypothetical protein